MYNLKIGDSRHRNTRQQKELAPQALVLSIVSIVLYSHPFYFRMLPNDHYNLMSLLQ